jgi:hypothetical protein
MAATLEYFVTEIKRIQHEARVNGNPGPLLIRGEGEL